MKRESIEISVVMATYNPSWDKCVFTLDSILRQKDITFELIVTDDGSKTNQFEKFTDYFESKGFEDYQMACHEVNNGTVKNFYDGIKIAKGKYIKLISPGDALFSETALADWLKFLKDSGKSWSFGDAVFINDNNEIVEAPAFPRIIDCYISGDEDKCRWNYVVLEDVALGAAIICEKDLMLKYLDRFLGKVKFAEDVIFSAMMYDGITPSYFNKNVMFYEFGSGISTGENAWLDKIHKDWREAEDIIASECSGEDLQKKINKALITNNSGSESKKRLVRNLQKGGIKKVIKHRLSPRMSSADITGCGEWFIKEHP